MHKCLVAGILTFAIAPPVQAEVLSFPGLEAAGNDAAAALVSIAVEPFGGIDGQVLSFRIEDALRGTSIDGRSYFRVLSGAAAERDSGILRGTADTDLTTERYSEERERCVKNGEGKCTEAKEKYKVKCQRRRFEMAVMIRLTRSDGTLLWQNDSPQTYQDSFCDDSSSSPRGGNDVVRDLTGRVANLVRSAFAPTQRWETVRVNESRKGLTAADAARFKQAVRLTKTDPHAACAIWEGLAVSDPGHVPSLFNAALCRESQGHRGHAAAGYTRVTQFDPKNTPAREGLVRIEVDQLARDQIRAHDQR